MGASSTSIDTLPISSIIYAVRVPAAYPPHPRRGVRTCDAFRSKRTHSMFVSLFRFRLPAFLVIILCSVFLLFAGCGAAPTPEPSQTALPEAASNDSTLTLWHTFDDKRRDALQDLTNEFHKTYPDLTINPVFVGSRDDLTKQMTAALALGNAPDLVLADRRQIAEFAGQDGLLALDSFLDDAQLGLPAQERSDYLRGALNLGKFPTLGNRTFGFPFYQEAFVLFYNADLMKTINVNRGPRTWEQFGEFASDISQESVYGWAMRANADTFEAMLTSNGSALLTDAETRALFNERAGIRSLQLVADLTEGGAGKLAVSDDQARREFAGGKAAFYLGWMSEINVLERAQKDAKKRFDIDVGSLPQIDPEIPWLLTRGDLFGITQVPKARARNAWFFVRWITSPTQSARWVRETDGLPLRLSALDLVAQGLAPGMFYEEIFKTFKGTPPRLAPQPASPNIQTIEQAVSSLWLQAVQPKPDFRVILDTMVARVNQTLAIQQ